MGITEKQTEQRHDPKIAIIGVGGGGLRALQNNVRQEFDADTYVIDTDATSILNSMQKPILLNEGALNGTGGSPEEGKKAAIADEERLVRLLSPYDQIYILAGMGGGTGSGAVPVIAQLAKEKSIPCIAIVTLPFHYEGRRRRRQAEVGIENLLPYVDLCVKIPAQQSTETQNRNTTVAEDFQHLDTLLFQTLSALLQLQRFDPRGFRYATQEKGLAQIGFGNGTGPLGLQEALRRASACPLLHGMFTMAKCILAAVTSPCAIEGNRGSTAIKNIAPDAKIMSCFTADQNNDGETRAFLIATEYPNPLPLSPPVVAPSNLFAAGGSTKHGKGGFFSPNQRYPRFSRSLPSKQSTPTHSNEAPPKDPSTPVQK